MHLKFKDKRRLIEEKEKEWKRRQRGEKGGDRYKEKEGKLG